MARIEPRSVAQRLSALTWIKDVAVSRNWISGDVGITVEPRKPRTLRSRGTGLVAMWESRSSLENRARILLVKLSTPPE